MLVGVLLASGLIGQEKDVPVKAKGMLPPNWKKLGLTDDQVQQVYRLQARYNAQIAELDAKIKELKKTEKAELEKVLTAAQKARLKEIVAGEDKKPDTAPDKKPGDKKPDTPIKKPTETTPKKP